MNIKEIQYIKARNEAVLQSIKKGRAPMMSSVNKYINEKFKYSPAGMPSFRPILGKRYETSNKNEFNKMLIQINNDLLDLYDADNYINNEVLSVCNYYESEKAKLTAMLNNLQNEIENIMTIIDQPKTSRGIGDSFEDFDAIDFVGDNERGVPKTDSYVDLRSKYASNNTEFINKVNLKNSKITYNILSEALGNEQITDISHALNDNANETWIQKVTLDANNKLNYSVNINLDEETKINTVSYIASSPRKQKITLCLIDKDGNRFTYNTITTIEKAEWNFKNKKIVTVLFEIEKQECDATNGTTYDYYIGSKNISLYNNIYLEQSTFVSNGIKINQPFSQIMFCAKQDTPASTNITYYIGIDNKKQNVSWLQVDNDKLTELNLLPKKKIAFDKAISANIIGETADQPIEKSSNLFAGVDMWEVRETSTNTPTKDILLTPVLKFERMDCVKYDINANTSTIYTTYADFEESRVIEAYFDGENVEHDVYINGAKIIGRADDKRIKYNIRVGAGTNKIQIFIRNKTSIKTSFKFSVYLQEFATIVRAIEECKEVDNYTLNYATHTDAFDKYTVIGNSILVNYDTSKFPIKYILEYRYLDNPDLFEDAELKIMATLVSKDANVTPKLYAYQATVL